jgi:hypothetical protein
MDNDWLIPFAAGAATSQGGLGKLFATFAEQLALTAAPYHARRIALAQAEAMKIAAKAEGEVAKIQLERKLELEKLEARATERMLKQEANRQKNLERIMANAALEIQERKSVSEKAVEKDWVSRFIEECQDVSDEDMQTVWGRIASGEVANPGTFSYRTLFAVKMLQPEIAHLFTRLCSFVWKSEDFYPILVGPQEADFLKDQGLTFAALNRLEQNSLIRYDPRQMFVIGFDPIPEPSTLMFHYHGCLHIVRTPPNVKQIFTGPVLLTDIGRELVEISGATPNEEYRKSVVGYWRSIGYEVQENLATARQP